MLFIDNVDLLDAKQQSCFFTFLDTGKIYSRDKNKSLKCNDLFLVLACSPQSGLQINRIIPVTIELPELKDRPMKERLDFINYFFEVEAFNSDRCIEVTMESIKHCCYQILLIMLKDWSLILKQHVQTLMWDS